MAWYEKVADNFNRADENPLSDGGNWTAILNTLTNVGPLKISSTIAIGSQTTNTHHISYRSGYAFANNQYGQVYQPAFLTGHTGGPVVRYYTSTPALYLLDANRGETKSCQVFKRVTNTWTSLGSDLGASYSATPGTVRLSISGTTLTVTDGTTDIGTTTDSTISSGYVGLYVFALTATLDNWTAGDDQAPPGHPTMARWGGVPYMTLGRRKW